jgi:GNAT superfamily N-acetyltransferase
MTLREAVPGDAAEILALIQELADYEELREMCVVTVEDVQREVFGANPVVHVLMAEEDGVVAGFALYFFNFSTFLGRRGIYLEDLFVRPEFRGRGIGKGLLLRLKEIATEAGYGRVEWSVLDWNTPSIEFYKSLGATAMDEWTTFRLTLG